ncbi:hypothetical protein EVJ58_g8631 [Rhodofomes roseus]|uniref:Uncharacterized protein n=1 Tax=Rhodofomes roseus TaxID=34475 RepID=A0A4Y9Y0A8_9APHY|nr:hypothetical protein EVJ58_g8631 [Rhodofomes roseus]
MATSSMSSQSAKKQKPLSSLTIGVEEEILALKKGEMPPKEDEHRHNGHPMTTVWYYPREVEILGCLTPDADPGDDANSGLNDEGDPDHRWMDAIVPFLMRFDLAQIEWLDLRDLSWGDIAPGTRIFLLTQFTLTRRLTLSAIDFWNSNQMLRTLNAFPNIHGLSMEKLSWHRANHTRKQLEGIADMHLRYLHIGQTEFARYGPFIKWLIGQRDVLIVDEAFIVWEDTEIMSPITLLRRLAPTLKSLIYQQCMILPGSELVAARLAAVQAAQGQAQHIAPVPVVNVPMQPTQAPQPAEVEDEPVTAANDGGEDELQNATEAEEAAADEDQADPPMGVDLSDDEGGDDDNNDGADDDDGDDDGANEVIHTNGPPIVMDDDESEEESVIEEYIAEHSRWPTETDALRDGMALLNSIPIEGSRVEHINARIAWSSLAMVGMKLVCQMCTAETKAFSLLLVLPPRHLWGRIDWLSIDSLLDDVAQRAAKDAILELSFLGAFAQAQEDLPEIRTSLTAKLPLLLARRRWTPKYDRSNLQ